MEWKKKGEYVFTLCCIDTANIAKLLLVWNKCLLVNFVSSWKIVITWPYKKFAWMIFLSIFSSNWYPVARNCFFLYRLWNHFLILFITLRIFEFSSCISNFLIITFWSPTTPSEYLCMSKNLVLSAFITTFEQNSINKLLFIVSHVDCTYTTCKYSKSILVKGYTFVAIKYSSLLCQWLICHFR